jgi:hypothetical protein
MYKTINQITIDHKEIAIKQHSKQIGYLTADVRRAKNSVTRAKMQSNFAIRHYTQMSRVHHGNTSWDWLRVAGGNKNLAEHFKKNSKRRILPMWRRGRSFGRKPSGQPMAI